MHLIVDDAKYNRHILSQYLQKLGISSEESADGQHALDLILSKGDIDHFDIVWMDLRMPIMDGIECTEKLREVGYNGIIIGVTGDVSKENIEKCYSIEMNHVILKPVIYKNLCVLFYIQKYIEQSE